MAKGNLTPKRPSPRRAKSKRIDVKIGPKWDKMSRIGDSGSSRTVEGAGSVTATTDARTVNADSGDGAAEISSNANASPMSRSSRRRMRREHRLLKLAVREERRRKRENKARRKAKKAAKRASIEEAERALIASLSPRALRMVHLSDKRYHIEYNNGRLPCINGYIPKLRIWYIPRTSDFAGWSMVERYSDLIDDPELDEDPVEFEDSYSKLTLAPDHIIPSHLELVNRFGIHAHLPTTPSTVNTQSMTDAVCEVSSAQERSTPKDEILDDVVPALDLKLPLINRRLSFTRDSLPPPATKKTAAIDPILEEKEGKEGELWAKYIDPWK